MLRILLTLTAIVSLGGTFPVQAQMRPNGAAEVCTPGSYAFPGAVIQIPGRGFALSKDARRTIAVLGQQALKANCTVTVICASADNSKEAFEAGKANCKLARDVIASTQRDDSATKKVIVTQAKRPKDGYAPNSINLSFK